MTIQVLGGLVLVAFGLKLYATRPRIDPSPWGKGKANVGRLRVGHPADVPAHHHQSGAVLGLFAIFGGVSSFVEVDGYIEALAIVAAVMSGSLAWWVGLSHLIGRFRHHITGERLGLINQIAGLLLLGFGVLLVGEVVLKRLEVL